MKVTLKGKEKSTMLIHDECYQRLLPSLTIRYSVPLSKSFIFSFEPSPLKLTLVYVYYILLHCPKYVLSSIYVYKKKKWHNSMRIECSIPICMVQVFLAQSVYIQSSWFVSVFVLWCQSEFWFSAHIWYEWCVFWTALSLLPIILYMTQHSWIVVCMYSSVLHFGESFSSRPCWCKTTKETMKTLSWLHQRLQSFSCYYTQNEYSVAKLLLWRYYA